MVLDIRDTMPYPNTPYSGRIADKYPVTFILMSPILAPPATNPHMLTVAAHILASMSNMDDYETRMHHKVVAAYIAESAGVNPSHYAILPIAKLPADFRSSLSLYYQNYGGETSDPYNWKTSFKDAYFTLSKGLHNYTSLSQMTYVVLHVREAQLLKLMVPDSNSTITCKTCCCKRQPYTSCGVCGRNYKKIVREGEGNDN